MLFLTDDKLRDWPENAIPSLTLVREADESFHVAETTTVKQYCAKAILSGTNN